MQKYSRGSTFKQVQTIKINPYANVDDHKNRRMSHMLQVVGPRFKDEGNFKSESS